MLALLAAVALAAAGLAPLPAAAQTTAPLVYVSSSEDTGSALVRSDPEGRETTVVARNASDPVWSPDRSEIAYVRYDAEAERSEVRIVAADGSGDRLLAEGTDVAWSPDGSRLVVTVVGEGLISMRPDGSDRRQLTTAGDHVADRVPRWSPDGRRIAFLRTDTLAGIPQPRLYVVEVDGGGEPLALTGPDEVALDPSWSPDGAWIALHLRTGQDEGGNFVGDVVKLRPDGSDRVALSDGRPAFAPAWSPGGEVIALAVDVATGGERDLDLFLVDRDGGNLRRILDIDRDVLEPVWSPDAAALAFTGLTCCAEGELRPREIWDVYTVDRHGDALRQLTDDGLSMEPDFPPPAPPIPATRLAGANRVATAATIALERLAGGDDAAPTVLLANAATFPDALAGSALAGHVEGLEGVVDAPLLLTGADELPEATAQALRELSARRVVLMGGAAAISDSVEQQLDEDYDVVRVAGPNRFATAAEAARRLAANAGGLGTVGGATTVIVASGERFPDALAAGPLGYANALPILLTEAERLPEATAAVIEELAPEQALVVGGTAAVSAEVAAAIGDAGVQIQRVAGPTRTATAARLADFAITQGLLDANDAALARGDAFPDALAGGTDAGERRAPILLAADAATLSRATADLLTAYCQPLALLVAYGGEAALRPDTVDAARRAATCG